jgi:hypothetical protein
MTDYNITCPCTGSTMNPSEWEDHFFSKDHIDWFTDSSDNINDIIIKCGCGDSYNYQNGHDHFKSAKHRTWQNAMKSRYENVLIICKCGDIIKYKDRSTHNAEHIIPVFKDDV